MYNSIWWKIPYLIQHTTVIVTPTTANTQNPIRIPEIVTG